MFHKACTLITFSFVCSVCPHIHCTTYPKKKNVNEGKTLIVCMEETVFEAV